ncbi:unnamed protein product, partial [Rotaria magnacalcarata]
YRPPELLLGERDYGPAIDMWGKLNFSIEFYIELFFVSDI